VEKTVPESSKTQNELEFSDTTIDDIKKNIEQELVDLLQKNKIYGLAEKKKKTDFNVIKKPDKKGLTLLNLLPPTARESPVPADSPEKTQELKMDSERLARVHKLRKLKLAFENTALKYNSYQQQAAEANKEIDNYKSQINEVESELEYTGRELDKIQQMIKSSNSEIEKQSLRKTRRELNTLLSKYKQKLKKYRVRLAKAVKEALEAEKQIEKAYDVLEKAEAEFSPHAETLLKEEKILSEDEALIEIAAKDAKEQEKRETITKKIQLLDDKLQITREKYRKKAINKIERELTLMKRESIQEARKEGRELTSVEKEQWDDKEKEIRKKMLERKESIDELLIEEFESEASKYLKKIEKQIYYPGLAGPDGISYQGSWPIDYKKDTISGRAKESSGNKFDINTIVVTGDREIVYTLKNWNQYENDVLYKPMTEDDIEKFRQTILKDLQDKGYVFATVSVYKRSPSSLTCGTSLVLTRMSGFVFIL